LLDSNLILRKLADLEEYLGQVGEFKAIALEAYRSDWKTQRIVERTLQMMIELCIDICNHLIADQKLRVPTSNADTFKVLQEVGLLSEQLFESMDKMAKFRNFVVHQYDKIDGAIVVTILRKHLDDFIVFRDAVLQLVAKESAGERPERGQ